MKTIDLNELTESDTFSLWGRWYTYSFKKNDQVYFRKQINNISLKNNIIQRWICVFTKILERENKKVEIVGNDIVSLIKYFCWKLL